MKATLIHWKSCFPQGRIFNALCVNPITAGMKGLLHTHDFAEVFWIRRGTGVHLVNGQKREMRPGDLTMIRPYRDAHKFLSGASDLTLMNIAFPAALLTDIKRRYFDSAFFWGGKTACPELYHLTQTEQQWLNAAADAMLDAPQSRILLDRFLLNTLCSIGMAQPDLFRACPDWLRQACESVRLPENLAGGIKTFFRLARRSSGHAARALKKYTGKTPCEFINAVRLEYAAAQLLNTTRDIQEISLDCGYSSLSYFYLLFKMEYGLSPRRYRLTFFRAPAQIMFPHPDRIAKKKCRHSCVVSQPV